MGTVNGVGRSRTDFTSMEVYRNALLVCIECVYSSKERTEIIQPWNMINYMIAKEDRDFAVLVAQPDFLCLGIRTGQNIHCPLAASTGTGKDSSRGPLGQYWPYHCYRSHVLACLASGLPSNLLFLGFCGSNEIRNLHVREDPSRNRVRLQLFNNSV